MQDEPVSLRLDTQVFTDRGGVLGLLDRRGPGEWDRGRTGRVRGSWTAGPVRARRPGGSGERTAISDGDHAGSHTRGIRRACGAGNVEIRGVGRAGDAAELAEGVGGLGGNV